ncbi:fatty acid desaturase [Pseudogemmobacter bohemicus]|uniref:fatty acid desaturase n=1 Tax=Pseudogemmobacter bohemicus TaxID=2250708 RepID=UPI000DD3EB85|nr:fatty acid desaturase [Pseudogemmobacter bohemicus]
MSEARPRDVPTLPGTLLVPPRFEAPTWGLVVLCYGSWLAAGFWLWPVLPWLALIVMGLAVALHSSLAHEVLHGHPTRNPVLNEALVWLPISIFYAWRSYKLTHLQHHNDARLTDPYDDPESYYVALFTWMQMPRLLQSVLRVNNTLIGRVVIGPWVAVIGFTCAEGRRILAGDAKTRNAWVHHLAGLAVVLPFIHFAMGIPVWLYLLVPAWLGTSLIAIRSYCEHQWAEDPNGRTIIVERSILAPLFLFNNLHFVHHKLPRVPWYRLPAAYRMAREEWQRLNGGYVFPSYFSILRTWGWRMKEQNPHPAWRRHENDTHDGRS